MYINTRIKIGIPETDTFSTIFSKYSEFEAEILGLQEEKCGFLIDTKKYCFAWAWRIRAPAWEPLKANLWVDHNFPGSSYLTPV